MSENEKNPTPGVDENEATPDRPEVDVTPVENEPAAGTAGEQNHSNPDKFRGDDADAPADTGKPAQEG